MEKNQRFTITSALPYTNGPIHIGHLAGAYLPADIYARYKRLCENDVAFICGSDEHGVAISIKAKQEGSSVKSIIDKYHNLIKDTFEEFGISFDNYSRTSNAIHHETSKQFFRKLDQDNCFEIKTTQQLYDENEKQFLADRFIEGECPKCGFEKAYGDQCENCGASLSPDDLINPKSKLSGSKPVLKETKHWYLPLGNYENFLTKWILEGKKGIWKPNVYGQVKSWIDQGLESRAISRDLDWGIPIPRDDAKGKVMYVWFDAPIGYISSTKEWAERENKNWEDYWKKSDTKLIHFIGKDNIVFHCIIFPSILEAHGEFILPENVPANEFLNLEGRKISTSNNWAIWLHEYLKDFKDMQDSLRYTLTVNSPESKDNDFTWKDFQSRNNNELVAILGNYINRVFILTEKYFNNVVPKYEEIDSNQIIKIYDYVSLISSSLDKFKFRDAVNHLIDLARTGNKYLADKEPWKLYKENNIKEVEQILYISLETCALISILSEPFIPNSAKRIRDIMDINLVNWTRLKSANQIIQPGHKIKKSNLIFRKIEDDEIENQLKKLNSNIKS
ncbi:MAG: methionine--tRNA ligase [Flavobacteriaceae bacterium]|nr:MAG: methionine--tRNA ligase [Flavobacteriaceae bacterium]